VPPTQRAPDPSTQLRQSGQTLGVCARHPVKITRDEPQSVGQTHKVRIPKEFRMNKSELLNWLQEEYQQWEALLERIDPTHMDQVGVNSQWSFKDLIAHLTQM